MIDRETCLFVSVSVLEEENDETSNFNQGAELVVECRIQNTVKMTK